MCKYPYSNAIFKRVNSSFLSSLYVEYPHSSKILCLKIKVHREEQNPGTINQFPKVKKSPLLDISLQGRKYLLENPCKTLLFNYQIIQKH